MMNARDLLAIVLFFLNIKADVMIIKLIAAIRFNKMINIFKIDCFYFID